MTNNRIKLIKNKLGKLEWYLQGGAVKPFYIAYPIYACSHFKVFGKTIKSKYEIAVFLKNNFMSDYISIRSLRKVAYFYFGEQRKNKKFIYELDKNWKENNVLPFLKSLKEYFNLDFSGLNLKELFCHFKIFTKIYLDLWSEVIFLDGFDYCGEEILEKALKKNSKEIKPAELEILLTPPRPSWLQKERLELLDIAERVLKNNKILKIVIKKELQAHSAKYHWLHNDFASVIYLGSDYFYKNLLLLLKDRNKLRAEQEMKKYLAELKRKKEKIIKKYRLPAETRNILNFLSVLGNLRDERKSYNQMAGAVLKKFAAAFAKKTKLDIKIIENSFFWEIKDILKLTSADKRRVLSRVEGILFFVGGFIRGEKEYCGEEAGALNRFLGKLIARKKDLKGMAAYRGFVKGEVKIIKDKNDFYKMKKGNILVAPNTRPEYVPIMKMAGAIISEEGGITCHSAIVARELKIPCIVGVQGVMLLLKDGDIVEVDANNGIVRKLSRR
ncbi:MAG: PEP-utilizing enzyme [Patescibacteria group bacterium]